MRIVCGLRALVDELSKRDPKFSLKKLAQDIGFPDERPLDKYLKGEGGLKHSMLRAVALECWRAGFDLLDVRPNAVWETFDGKRPPPHPPCSSPVVILRGERGGDTEIEGEVSPFWKLLWNSTRTSLAADEQAVADVMRSQNCFIIGSPKANPASEIALSLLWGATPFDGAQANRQRLPVQFRGMRTEHPGGKSALLQPGTDHCLQVTAGATPRTYPATWLAPGRYQNIEKNDCPEAAVVAACYQPLGTQHPVTTVIVAGYTGVGTGAAALAAMYDTGMPDKNISARPGEPHFWVVTCRYRKTPTKGLGPDREVIPESVLWRE